ncbi:MAG: gamma-glutamyl-gamma-aminobutyrate hydrolase family protein [Oscillospiraceae bacterium]|nr:gamma-glutamyl-gamma-aminobutyrate hydrolase family protein [Oscillospiraceae bacterium]
MIHSNDVFEIHLIKSARDGVIEAIEVKEERILGVQWHPEEMVHAYPEHLSLFKKFVAESCRTTCP